MEFSLRYGEDSIPEHREDMLADPTIWLYVESLVISPKNGKELSLETSMAILDTMKIIRGYKAFI